MTELGNKEIMSRNLRSYMQRFGLSKKDLAEQLDVKYTTLVDWVNGNTYPRIDKIELLANFFNISKSELVESPSSTFVEKTAFTMRKLTVTRQEIVYNTATEQLAQQHAETQSKQDTPDNVVDFPVPKPDDEPETRNIVTGRETAAGAPINGDDQDGVATMERVNIDDIPRGADEIVTVDGDSMEPEYPRYSQIFVHWQDEIESGEKAIIHVEDEGVTFKQIYLDYAKHIVTLHSLNAKYPDRVLPCNQVRIIGKVIN